jgi:hypothetical protein
MGFETGMRGIPEKYKKRGEWFDCRMPFQISKELKRIVQQILRFCLRVACHLQTCIFLLPLRAAPHSRVRSARQGCPAAPILYIIQAEPMACAIRNTPEIHGIKLPDCEGFFQMSSVSILYPWKTPKVFILSEIHDMLVNLGRFPLNLPINNPFVFS